MNMNLYSLEKKVLDAILKRNKEIPGIENLYQQCDIASVKQRVFTGGGFYTEFDINTRDLDIEFQTQKQLGGIYAKIEGLDLGAGFALFINNGYISTLEGYSYGEIWPDNAKIIALFSIQEDGSLIKMR